MFNYLIRLEAASSRQITFLVVWAIDNDHAQELGEVLATRTGLLLVDVQNIEEDLARKNPENRDRTGGG